MEFVYDGHLDFLSYLKRASMSTLINMTLSSQNITGFEFKLPDPVTEKQLSLDEARQLLKSFVLSSDEKSNTSSSSSTSKLSPLSLTVTDVKVEVDKFLSG